MSTLALILAAGALAVALLALAKATGARVLVEDAGGDARRRASNVEEALHGELEVLRAQVARLASGEAVNAEMVREVLLWRDVPPREAVQLVERGDVWVLDVRTAAEVTGGMLPGATHVPIEQVVARAEEIPQDKDVLVYCAGGARSAEVCDVLSRRGFDRMLNLEGGIGAWPGPVEKPA